MRSSQLKALMNACSPTTRATSLKRRRAAARRAVRAVAKASSIAARAKAARRAAASATWSAPREHKRKLEAEANGEEYIPANPHHNNGGEKKRSLSERQAAADAAYAAMFDTPNMEGGKKTVQEARKR